VKIEGSVHSDKYKEMSKQLKIMMSTCDLGVRDWLAGKKPRSVKSEIMSLHDFPERGFLTSGGPSTSVSDCSLVHYQSHKGCHVV